MQTTLYGIPNCDSVKKARKWLGDHQIQYHFHNYKKDGVATHWIKEMLAAHGWEAIINRRGTSWRKLEETTRNSMNDEQALPVILENSSLIKRPILTYQNATVIGFSEERYVNILKEQPSTTNP